jgi:uncharacterized coiled-coil DUF342 family protein
MSRTSTLFNNLCEERDVLVTKSTPLREQRNKILEEIAPQLAKARELANQIKKIEQPVLAEIKNELAGLARALGAKTAHM